MKNLSKNDLFYINGGAECEVKEGLLNGKLNLPAHPEEQKLVVMIVLRDPLGQTFTDINKAI